MSQRNQPESRFYREFEWLNVYTVFNIARVDLCSGFSSIRFSTVLIDEATQATEAAALVPIIRGCQQLILVGDQNQVSIFF